MDFKEFDYTEDFNDFDGTNELSSEEKTIEKYREDEQMMIGLFVQWCINHELDPNKLYAQAYPEQPVNPSLQTVLKEMDDGEKIELAAETLLDVLQLFGNFDLAFVVSEELARIKQEEM